MPTDAPLIPAAGFAAEPLAVALPATLAGAGASLRRSADSPKPPDDDLPRLATAGDLLDAAPAWLFSAIVHMVLVIILGLIFISRDQGHEFVLSLSTEDDGGEDLQPGDVDVPVNLDEPLMAPGDAMEPLQLPGGESTEFAAAAVQAPLAPTGAIAQEQTAISMALTGREAGMKEALSRAYGGTSGTETAVTEALRWLARNQARNSLWSLTGPYDDGASSENPDAATAMALLAFQGAGYTPESDRHDPFTRVVAQAWPALLKRQDEHGNFFQEGSGSGRLYTQAFCTIAICELYGMTRDSKYREPAQRAVDYCLEVQAPEGGWRYEPGFDSDTSVSGWFVMALQSARMAGLTVPSPALTKIGKYLDTVSYNGGAEYSYHPGQGEKLSMTAEGLLCRQYLGWPRNDERLQRGVDVLAANLPYAENGRTHSYYWYYAAQVCHHMEGEPWRAWNGAMREVLPRLQIKDGRERGSWDPNQDDTQGVGGGGRLFVTCLNTYMLEVYYRHLPLYRLELLAGAK